MQIPGLFHRIAVTSAAIVLSFTSTTGIAQQITFTDYGHITVSENQSGLVLADFAHKGTLQTAAVGTDGSLEIAIPNPNSPATGYYSWNSYTAGAGSDGIVTADFNGDGNLDLAVQNGQDFRLSIFLGNGDASFRAAPDVLMAWPPRAIVATDFDHDGLADLAIVECSAQAQCALKRMHSRGDGTFANAQKISLPGSSLPLKAGMMTTIDFNQDRNNDIALIAANRTVMIYTSSSTGQLTLHTQFDLPNGSIGTSIVWGSVDHQRPPVPDLAVRTIQACGSSCGFQNSVYVFLNDGEGYFHQSARVAVTPSSSGGLVGLGDINGDQRQDIITINTDPYSAMLEYALGHNDGTFGTAVQVMSMPHASNAPGVTNEARAFVMRDLNRDSRLDLAYAGYDAIGDDMAGTFLDINDNSAKNCTPPSPAHLAVRFCSPTISQVTAGQPFRVSAAGDSPAGVKRLELWVDGRKVFETWDYQMRTWITVGPGTHRMEIVAVDLGDTHVVKSQYVTAN
jgi:hypothetical protein